MLRSLDLATWLTGKLAALTPPETAPVTTGPLSGLHESPDRVIAIMRQGGRAPDDEGHLYTVTFRVEARGAQRDYDSAEVLADEIDDVLLDAPMPQMIGGWRVVAIGALLRPTPVGVDSAERWTLNASYEIQVPAA